MVECACHLAGGFGVSGHFQLQSEFEVHLGYMRCNLKKMRGGEGGREIAHSHYQEITELWGGKPSSNTCL